MGNAKSESVGDAGAPGWSNVVARGVAQNAGENGSRVAPPKPNEQPHIAWLASYPGSGNTWVRMFLTAYRYGAVYLNMWPGLVKPDSWPYFYDRVSPVPFGGYDFATQIALRPAVLLHLLAAFPEKPLILKTHFSNGELNGFRSIPPWFTNRALYLVRDPRDVALTFARHFGFELKEAIRLICDDETAIGGDPAHAKQFLGAWSSHVFSWGQEKQFPVLIVRYEDLQQQPERAFLEIARFMFPDDDDVARVAQAVQLSSFGQLQSQEKQHGFVEAGKSGQFFHKGQVGRWKEILSDGQARILWDRHGEMMKALGYTADGVGQMPEREQPVDAVEAR